MKIYLQGYSIILVRIVHFYFPLNVHFYINIYNSSKLTKLRRKVESLKEVYEADYQKFREKEKTNFWQFKAIDAYKKEERLDNWREEINEQILHYKKCQKTFDEELAKAEVQERFEILRKKLYLRRESANRFIDELKAENEKIAKFRSQLFRMNKVINGRSKYTVDEGAVRVLEYGSFAEVKEALKKIHRAIKNELEEERKVQNKMRINLRGNAREDDSGYDIGI